VNTGISRAIATAMQQDDGRNFQLGHRMAAVR